MTTPGPLHSEARAGHRHDDDVTTLLGMHTRAAWVIVSIYIAGTALAAAGTLDGVSSVFPIALAVTVNAASAIALIAVSGDPLPWRATTAITLAGPASCALVLAALPVPITSPLQTWPIGAATAVYTFMCVRGRTWPAWAGLLGIVAVCVVWSQVTGQGAIHGITMSAISAGPLLMGTFFAYTIRPSAKAIFRLREETTRQIADEAAAAARLSERDAQLNRLDTLARPMLERISTGEPLSTEEMLQCRLLEAHLRDTLRAPALADPLINDAARAARRRGVDVVLLDDHGMEGIDPVARRRILLTVADELNRAESGSITARVLPPGRALTASVLVSNESGSRRVELEQDGHIIGHDRP